MKIYLVGKSKGAVKLGRSVSYLNAAESCLLGKKQVTLFGCLCQQKTLVQRNVTNLLKIEFVGKQVGQEIVKEVLFALIWFDFELIHNVFRFWDVLIFQLSCYLLSLDAMF